MRKKAACEIENHLAAFRQKRGFTAAALAEMAGVSRQTVYAIEAGNYVPNTLLALKLSRILEANVEELFLLPNDSAGPTRYEQVELLAGDERPQPGQPLQLCRVDERMLASAPAPLRWYFPASDGVVTSGVKQARTKVQIFHPQQEFSNRILIAGCDPGISVLARHAQTVGIDLVLAHRNSSQALELLKDGCIHVAGTHLRDEPSGESNLPEVGRLFSKQSVAVISFAVWEEGIITAQGNPKSIRGVEDFSRPDVKIVNRESGAGSRRLLDSNLKRLGIDVCNVQGYGRIAPGHLPAAWQVHSGMADCCIATRAAARLFGLGFLPLVSERYDLAIRTRHLDIPAIQTMLDVLSRSSFRRELESLGGYDTKGAGQRML